MYISIKLQIFLGWGACYKKCKNDSIVKCEIYIQFCQCKCCIVIKKIKSVMTSAFSPFLLLNVLQKGL